MSSSSDHLDPALFEQYLELIHSRTGVLIADSSSSQSRIQMLANRLAKPIARAGVRDFRSYLIKIQACSAGDVVWKEFIHAITTHKTNFFREPHHFACLREFIRQKAARAPRSSFEIWSAGCSTGEEPYSIAFTALPEIRSPLHILATDLDATVLETASKAVYRMEVGLGRENLQRYFLRGTGSNASAIRVKDEFRAPVRFETFNLIDRAYPHKQRFDAIFCRNVLIYFGRSTREHVIGQLVSSLAPDGLLFLGNAESLAGHPNFESVAPTVYRYRKLSRSLFKPALAEALPL